MDRPNILYIHSHDTGRYIQPYGHGIPTPNMQRLAEQGIFFRQAFSAAPTCSPSRAALLTGRCPHSCGQFGLANRGFYLPDCSKHIVHTLRKYGYYSALVGIQHIVRRDKAELIGYDEVADVKSQFARDVAPGAADFLDRKPRVPFFLSVGFFETHRIYPRPSLAEDPAYCLPPAPFPDTPETRQDMACFRASAKALDHGIGMVLASLERNGLAENTLVICTTDHGLAFPTMKCNLTDHGTGVMLIMRGPGGFSGGKVSDALISHIDLFPTLCDLLEIERPEWLEGKSMIPLIRGQKKEINEEVYTEVNFHCPYDPQRAVRTKRWKYIRRYLDRKTPLLANCDPSPSKELYMRSGWADRTEDREQLYDLLFDPNESCNLVGSPSTIRVLEQMRQRLARWMKETADPLLEGDIPAPPTATVSRPEDTEPWDIWEYTEKPEGYA
jgi:N-sulfoglucosamine sulfohydrolase